MLVIAGIAFSIERLIDKQKGQRNRTSLLCPFVVHGRASMSTKQNTVLRKLKKREIERLRDRFVAITKPGDSANRRALYEALQVKTRIDLPLGELANPEMRGLVLVWSMTKAFVHGEITDQHQFNAQGLEGLVSINDVPLGQALLAAIKTGLYRIAHLCSSRRTQPRSPGRERASR